MNVDAITNLSGNALAVAILFFFIRYFIAREEKREAQYLAREERRETQFIAREDKRDAFFGKILEENTSALSRLTDAVDEIKNR